MGVEEKTLKLKTLLLHGFDLICDAESETACWGLARLKEVLLFGKQLGEGGQEEVRRRSELRLLLRCPSSPYQSTAEQKGREKPPSPDCGIISYLYFVLTGFRDVHFP